VRTSRTVTIPAGQATGFATLGPFTHGSLLQVVGLFGQDPPADVTVRLALFDRPPVSVAEFDGGDHLAYDLVVPTAAGWWTLGLPIGSRLLSKRYVAVEFRFGSNLGAAWVGGVSVGHVPPIVQRQAAQSFADYIIKGGGLSSFTDGGQPNQ
jgi:hypothetical protein